MDVVLITASGGERDDRLAVGRHMGATRRGTGVAAEGMRQGARGSAMRRRRRALLALGRRARGARPAADAAEAERRTRARLRPSRPAFAA